MVSGQLEKLVGRLLQLQLKLSVLILQQTKPKDLRRNLLQSTTLDVATALHQATATPPAVRGAPASFPSEKQEARKGSSQIGRAHV